MPRRGGGGHKGRHGRDRGRGGGGGRGRDIYRFDKKEIAKENERFEGYYNGVLHFESEEEKADFWAALRRDLPNSFRFTGSKGHALAVQQRLIDHYIPEIIKIEWEGKKVEPPESIPWFPDGLAWQMTTPKNVVRRFPPLKAFQQFLVSETSVGNISRQEIVSMIPPLLLDIKPHHIVLDMCAAPGSKAAQLIEAIHAGEEARLRKVVKELRKRQGRDVSPDGAKTQLEMEDLSLMQDESDDGRSTGLLIANDADYKRAHMLIHQMKRLNSPNLIVMNHDATMFPSIKIPSLKPTAEQPRPPNRYLKFDRILADVPCSGDGTVRKNFNVWKDWSPSNGLGLHTTQIKILVRALQMLKVGGRVVYSTCSMNPIENEAVVSAAIARCGGLDKVAIMEASSTLPGLKFKRGMKNWKVMDKTGRNWSSFKEVEDHLGEHGVEGLSRVNDSMFAPSSDVPLERCIRIEPHQQDTGGFFIAILEKRSEIRARTDPGRTAMQIQAEAEAIDETTNPGQPMPSMSAIVKEIESKTPDANGAISHIESLDALAPPVLKGEDDGNMSAAARSNAEIATENGPSTTKRAAEESLDSSTDPKRIKTNEIAEGEQLEHYPPPPASRPDVEIAHATAKNAQVAHGEASAQNEKSKQSNLRFEEPYKYLDPGQMELQSIYDFYELDPKFPRDRYMVRNASGEPVKTIYYTSALSRDILSENEGKGMKFVHSGVKMFVRQDIQREDQCPWRIQTDGLQLIEAWISEDRVVHLTSRKTLHRLLKEMFPKVDGGGWRDLGEVGERVRDIFPGCCVLRVETGEGEDSFSERMVLPLWRSMHSVNLMLPKEDRRALLLRLFNDNSEIVDLQKQRASKGEAQARAAEMPHPSAENNDPPPPRESLLINQRAADLEEVAENFGEPSDDDDEGDEMGVEGGNKLDPGQGVRLEPDQAEESAKKQLHQEEDLGMREGAVSTENAPES